MKQKLIFFLAALLFLPHLLRAQQTFTVGDFNYTTTGANTVEVTGAADKNIVEAIIPEKVIYNSVEYAVTSINSGNFASLSSLKYVIIPPSIVEYTGFIGFSKKGVFPMHLSGFQFQNGGSSGTSNGGLKVYDPDDVLFENGVVFNKDKTKLIMVPYSLSGTYVVPNSVREIGEYAFYNCYYLTGIEIPDNVESLGRFSLADCLYLKTVNLSHSIKELPDYVFSSSGLAYIAIPKSVTSIGESAFSRCSSLKTVYVPESVESCGNYAFSNCKLDALIFDNSSTAFFANLTYGCEIKKYGVRKEFKSYVASDKKFIIPTLNNLKFDGNLLLSADEDIIYFSSPAIKGEYIIPENIKEITENAFALCDGITSIKCESTPPLITPTSFIGLYDEVPLTIPQNRVGEYLNSFSPWNLFKNINIEGASTASTFEFDGMTYRYVDNTHAELIANESYKDITNVVIPEKVNLNGVDIQITGIAEMAFAGCENLVSVTIPSSVTRLGDAAFQNCTSLTAISLPVDVKRIGSSAFDGCQNLTEFTCGNDITEIGMGAFFGTKITTINLPNIERIDSWAFDGVSTLTNIAMGNSIKYIGNYAFRGVPFTGINLQPETNMVIGSGAFMNNDVLKTISLGEGVETIGEYAFLNSCKSVRSFEAPKSLKRIGRGAFYTNNAGFRTLTLPKDGSLAEIGDSAFVGVRVAELDLPDALERIGNDAFRNARAVTKIVMPKNRKLSVGHRAFLQAQYLEELEFPEIISSIGDSCFVDNVLANLHVKADNIGKLAFTVSPKLKTLQVSGTGIMDEGAFRDLPELVSAHINIGTIGNNAFITTPKLETVTFGDTVKVIGEKSFYNSPLLYRVHFGLGLEKINDRAFEGTKVDSISFPSAPIANPVIEVGNSVVSATMRYLSLGNRVKSLNGSYFQFSSDKEVECFDLGTSVETIYANGIRVGSVLAKASLTTPEKYAVGRCHINVIVPTSLKEFGACCVNADTIFMPATQENLKISWDNKSTYEESTYSYPLLADRVVIERPITGPILSRYTFGPGEIIFGDNEDIRIDWNGKQMKPCCGASYVYVGSSVKSIDNLSAARITIKEGVETINSLSVGVKSIAFPSSLKEFGYFTSSVEELIFSDTDEPLQITNSSFFNSSSLKSLYLGRNLTKSVLASDNFKGCANLESVIIGDKVTKINDNMFQNCTALTNCVMGDNVQSIGESAFEGCTGLDILSLGESVKNIGTNAYKGCTGFSRIVARGTVVPEGDAGFGAEVEQNVPLFVPEAAYDDYFDSDLFWKFHNFETHTDKIVEEVESVKNDGVAIDEEFTVGHRFCLHDLFKFIFHKVGHALKPHSLTKSRIGMKAEETDPAIRWFSPNPHIASVDQDGNVTINGEGDLEIWGYVLDGSDKKVVLSLAKDNVVKGDINGDSEIDVLDLNKIIVHILDPQNNPVEIKVADINEDNDVDVMDLNSLIQIISNAK